METRSHLEPYTSRPSTGRATEISVWHVAVSPDDVKVMTLEQLDDAFRLDVIDTSTPVWKNGMSTWSTLGNVAGIEDEPSVTTVKQDPHALWPPPSWPPPRNTAPASIAAPVRPASRPPPPVLRPTVAPSGPAVEAAQAAARTAATTVRPPPPSSRAAEPRPSARHAVSTVHMVPSFSVPASIPPVAASVVPLGYPAARRSGALGRWLVALTALAGVVLTLYRNDVLLRLARSSHREAEYLRVERLLGGPSFGTLRSVDALKSLREKLTALAAPSTLAAATTPMVAFAPAEVRSTPVSESKPAVPADDRGSRGAVDVHSLPLDGERIAPVTAAAPPPRALPKAPAAPPKATAPVATARAKEPAEKAVAAPAGSEPSESLKAAMATGRGGKKGAPADIAAAPAKDNAAKPASEATHTASGGGLDLKAAMGDAVRRHPPKKKSKGAEYDPLNGDL